MENKKLLNEQLLSLLAIRTQELHAHWPWYLALGIALVIGGVFALIFSSVTTLASVIYLGVALMFVGLVELIQAFRVGSVSNFFLHLVVSILSFIVGALMTFHPVENAMSLTLLLGAFFLAIGIFRIIFSFTMHIPQWVAVLVNGILTTILGGIILYQWPISGLWAIGILVAIDMLFTGWTWILLSLKAKDLPK